MKTTRQKHENPGLQSEAIANYSINGCDYLSAQGASKAKLKAQFALAGYVVHDGCDNDFFVVRVDWGMSRHCEDIAALHSFARLVGLK